MNDLKNITWLLCLFISLSCQNSSSSTAQIYANQISFQGDVRMFYLEFEPKDPSKIRWGIEKAGRHRLPLINASFDTSDRSFSGDLTFFGSEIFGSLEGKFTGNKIEGQLIWHGDTISIALLPTQRKLPYKEVPLSFSNGDISLKGTLILPIESKGPFPAVVFAHGSGPFTRWWGMYWAEALAQRGVATLLHDKRGCGESQGNWIQASLDDLSADVVSGIDLLAKHPLIDKYKIGIYGVSQGGWVASRVSTMTDQLAFVIVNSGGGIPPLEEEKFSYQLNMEFAGINEAARAEGMELVNQYFQYLKSEINREEIDQKMEKVKNKDWYPILGLERVLVSEDNRKNWEWVATYDPKEDIRNMKTPVLLLFGDQDFIQPTDLSIKYWKQAFKAGNHTQYQIRIFEGAGHGLAVGGHHAKGFPKYAAGHLDTIMEWLDKNIIQKVD